jgi:hypothetical protein
MTAYPFPFFGAGDATYFEWGEIQIVFAKPPTQETFERISSLVPLPLTDSIELDGRCFCASSSQLLHVEIYTTYDQEGSEEPEDLGGRFFFAPQEHVDRFNEDVERFLLEAHELCPIALAYRPEDGESGGTDFSRWHEWSLDQDVWDLLSADPDQPESREWADAHASVEVGALDPMDAIRVEIAHGVATYMLEAGRDVPPSFRTLVDPGWAIVEALESGDVQRVIDLLGKWEEDRDEIVIHLMRTFDPDSPEEYTDLVEVCLRVLREVPDIEDQTRFKFAKLAVLVECPASEEILKDLAPRIATDEEAADLLGEFAYDLTMDDLWEGALRLFDYVLPNPHTPLTTYCNALYAVQDDNNELGVKPELARRFLALCLPHGPDNPAIFVNAACVYMELGEDEEVFRCFEAALEHGYDRLEQFRDEPLFAPLAQTERYREIFSRA